MTIAWSELSAEQVEHAVAALLVRLHPRGYAIDGRGGDDGADVVVPTAGGEHVFQIKRFTSRLTASQRAQIVRSFETARTKRATMIAWTLVVPLDPSPAEERWFAALAESAGVPAEWWGATRLNSEFAARPDIARAVLPNSVERRALDLLGQYDKERAGLAGGLPDAIERAQALQRITDEIDPDYRFEVTTAQGQTTISAYAKDEGAAARSPILGSLTLDAPAGSRAAQEIAEFRDWGAPLTLDAEHIIDVAVSLPAGLGDLMADAVPAQVKIDPQQLNERGQLVSLRAGQVTARLRATLVQVTAGRRGTRLVFHDDGECLTVALTVSGDAPTGVTTFNFTPRPGTALDYGLDVCRFVTCLCDGDHLRIELPSGTLTPKIRGVPEQVRSQISWFLDLLTRLQRVQDACGRSFTVPIKVTGDDDRLVWFLDVLLAGGTAAWEWPDRTLTVPADAARQAIDQMIIPRVAVSGSGREPFAVLGDTLELPRNLRLQATNVVVRNAAAVSRSLATAPTKPVVLDLTADERTQALFWLDDPEATG